MPPLALQKQTCKKRRKIQIQGLAIEGKTKANLKKSTKKCMKKQRSKCVTLALKKNLLQGRNKIFHDGFKYDKMEHLKPQFEKYLATKMLLFTLIGVIIGILNAYKLPKT